MPAPYIKFEELNSLAAEQGGRCLSKEYINQDTELIWQCKKGHVFHYNLKSVRRGAWCPQCTQKDRKAVALELMKEWAEKYEGKCLSDEYINNETKLIWQCKNGHIFTASRDRIKLGRWCTECTRMEFKNKKLKQVQEIALKREGKCLSEKYVNDDTKLEFQCSKGHKWKATPHIIIYDNSWCPYCYGKVKHTIEYMHEIAKKHNGKCLSKTYVNNNAKLEWQCSEGHKWKTTSFTIINDGSWCPYCAKKVKHTIEQMYELAEKKGGKCLSDIYINNRTKLEWQCSKGHIWKSVASSVLRGHWCKQCYFERSKLKFIGNNKKQVKQ